jgi:hypothetical protein
MALFMRVFPLKEKRVSMIQTAIQDEEPLSFK